MAILSAYLILSLNLSINIRIFINDHLIFSIIVLLNIIFSIITFILYVVDKIKAKHNAWRIKERTLLLATLFFGAFGGLLGIFLVRHKTKHYYFILTALISTIIQVVLLIYTFSI